MSDSGFVSTWQSIDMITAESDGSRKFCSGTGLVITFGPEYQAGAGTEGDATELLLGIPKETISLTFNGGTQTTDGPGDILNFASGISNNLRFFPSSLRCNRKWSPQWTT